MDSLYFYQIITWLYLYKYIGINNNKEISNYFHISQIEWFVNNVDKFFILLSKWGLKHNQETDHKYNYTKLKLKSIELNNKFVINQSIISGHQSIVEIRDNFKIFLKDKYDFCNQALWKMLNKNQYIIMGKLINW